MCKIFVFRMIVAALVSVASLVSMGAQEEAPKAAAKASPFTSLLGEVAAIGADSTQITLKPETGSAVDVKLDAKTHFMKVAPGEKDLKKASDVQFSEIGVGDRVLARVRKLDDGSLSAATTVVVMTKSAIAQHQERGQAEWQTRGVVGTVTLVNPATNEITLKPQGNDGKQIVVEPADKVSVRRYAPNSVKFSDSTPSAIAEIKTGDTIRVLGTKNEDGTRVKPEEIVYGSFVRQAGTILAIDAAAGTVRMTDLATKKPVVVKVDASTSMKKLPSMMAQMMVGGSRPGGSGAGGPGGGRPSAESSASAASGAPGTGGSVGMRQGQGRSSGSDSAPSGGPGGAGSSASDVSGVPGGMRQAQGRPGNPEAASGNGAGRGPGGPNAGGGGAGRRMDPSKMMEQMPTITLADLKAGDAIMVSSSGVKDGMIAAITLVAGVEPLLTAPSRPGQASGPNTSWNFEMSMPQ